MSNMRNPELLEEPEPAGSICFFPLRSNVGYFDEPTGYLSLIERIKQASLLYDNILFESGVYQSVILQTGVWDFWMPRERVSDADLDSMSQNHKPTGGDSLVLIQPEGGNAVAWSGLSGPVDRRLHSEFYTAIRGLAIGDLPWIHFASIELTSEGNDNVQRLTKLLYQDFDQLIPHNNKKLRAKIIMNLIHDLVVSEDVDSATFINTIYDSYLRHSSLRPSPQGSTALSVTCPNLSHLSWEEICHIRAMDAMVEFRQKLFEVEADAKAALQEPDAWEEAAYKLKVLQTFNQNVLTRALADRQPKLLEGVSNMVLDLLYSVIGGIAHENAGLLLGPLMTSLRLFSQQEQTQKSWVTAYMRLQPPEWG